jgi:uncharacterized membrane protein
VSTTRPGADAEHGAVSRWGSFLDQQVARQRARRDPLARLPWWVTMGVALLVLIFGVAQVALGTGLSRVLGVALLVFVVPSQLVAAWAARRVARLDRR